MEACERFSYYGMRAILTIYLIYLLKVKFYKTGQNTSLVRTLALSKKPPPGTNIHIVYSGLPINFKLPFLKPHYPDNEEKASSVATMIFHFFAFGSYASGLLGAALADSKAGPRHPHPHVHRDSDVHRQQNADQYILCLENCLYLSTYNLLKQWIKL